VALRYRCGSDNVVATVLFEQNRNAVQKVRVEFGVADADLQLSLLVCRLWRNGLLCASGEDWGGLKIVGESARTRYL